MLPSSARAPSSRTSGGRASVARGVEEPGNRGDPLLGCVSPMTGGVGVVGTEQQGGQRLGQVIDPERGIVPMRPVLLPPGDGSAQFVE
jgi:hypothetical protein